jgi:hypothetical protein
MRRLRGHTGRRLFADTATRWCGLLAMACSLSKQGYEIVNFNLSNCSNLWKVSKIDENFIIYDPPR